MLKFPSLPDPRGEAITLFHTFIYSLFTEAPLHNQSLNDSDELKDSFQDLIEAVFQAIVKVGSTQNLEDALLIRDEIRRLPDHLVTEILNQIILRLVVVDPDLCRWFVIDVFLYNADPEAKADIAERINLLLMDLRSSSSS